MATLALPLAFALGCLRMEMAYVKVSDPAQVAVFAHSPPAEIAEEALSTGTAGKYRAALFAGSMTLERRADGSVVEPPFPSERETLVGADGAIAPFPATLLPTDRAETFATKQRWPIHSGRLAQCDFYCAFTLSTPWSNVEHVTIKDETSVTRSLVVLGIGTIAMMLGGLALRSAHENEDKRALWTASGAGMGALGLTLDVFAIVALFTPDEERAWTPPK